MTEQVDAAVAANHLSPDAASSIKQWLNELEYIQFRPEIEALVIAGDWTTLNDSFFKHITFGTAGMRGPVGVGPNRINVRTIGEATQGFVSYLKTQRSDRAELRIVVAYDMRLTHDELSKYCASVLAANGVKVLRFESWRATPELSFAIRYLKADAGIVISASHNPPADNGFKAFWSDGGQILAPHDQGITQEVANVSAISVTSYAEAVEAGQIEPIGEEVDEAYVQAMLAEGLSASRSAHIVYSPIHGCGQRSVLPLLERAGFSVGLVESQMVPDGHFPNVPNSIANPEIPSANEAAGQQLVASGADLGLTTDPDADRIAALIPDHASPTGYRVLDGNRTVALVSYYVLSTLKQQGKLPQNGFVARTIVTTAMLDAMALEFGVTAVNDLLIGFKYVARAIRERQDDGDQTFLLAGEESYGLLKGSYTRDKDAAVAALMLAEYASVLKDEGRTLLTALDDLYRRYGYYLESQLRFPFPGAAGFSAMNTMMTALRDTPPTTLGGLAVTKSTTQVQAVDGSFVVRLFLGDDSRNVVTVRPSGTEPIVKIYTALYDERGIGATDLAPIEQALRDSVTAIETDLQAIGQQYVITQ